MKEFRPISPGNLLAHILSCLLLTICWVYIGAKGSGGFNGGRPKDHAWGGPRAVEFAGGTNSDIENGQIKKDAPEAQLYNLESDPNQTKNFHDEYPNVAKEMAALLKSYRPKKSDRPHS